MLNNKKHHRHIALLLSLAMLLPLFATGAAAVTEQAQIGSAKEIVLWGYKYDAADVNMRSLQDAAGNSYVLYEVGNEAYFIYDPVSDRFLEGSPSAPSPYLDYTGELLYLGPQNYYVASNDVYNHTVLGDAYDLTTAEVNNLQASFDVALSNVRSAECTSVATYATAAQQSSDFDNMVREEYDGEEYVNYYVQYYWNIVNASYPPNDGGTCGYVSACLLLYYWHKRLGGIIHSNYLLSTGKLNPNGTTINDNLQKKLLSYGYNTSTWALDIRDVLYAYCSEYGISAQISYYLTSYGYYDSLTANRPVILFGSLPDPQTNNSTRALHAVLAYGIHTDSTGTFYSIITHYGWPGYYHVLLDYGLIGSVTLFRPQ